MTINPDRKIDPENLLMKPGLIHFVYSCEHDNSRLNELASDVPDPEKVKILAYLNTNLIAICPGVCDDEITPGERIGFGNLFSDGKYLWDDVFTNYVKKYNIPVPYEFRSHILANFTPRMKRHALFNLIDRIEIHNNPYLGYFYNAVINKNGVIEYRNNTDCTEGTSLMIKAEEAEYIITPISKGLFCYDPDNHGSAIIDGYHWKLSFYIKDNLIDEIEGLPGEDVWRYSCIKRFIKYTERQILKDLGSKLMRYIDLI